MNYVNTMRKYIFCPKFSIGLLQKINFKYGLVSISKVTGKVKGNPILFKI